MDFYDSPQKMHFLDHFFETCELGKTIFVAARWIFMIHHKKKVS